MVSMITSNKRAEYAKTILSKKEEDKNDLALIIATSPIEDNLPLKPYRERSKYCVTKIEY